MAYIGNSPENIQRGKRFIYEFTSTAGQTAYSGSDDNNQILDLLEANEQSVFLNGVRLIPTDDYTVSGDTLTLTSAASLNDFLVVETQTEVGNMTSYTRAEADARYINYDGDIVAGDLQISGEVNAGSLIVDTNTLVVDATNNRVGVGIASPSYTLDIASSGTLLNMNSTNSNGIGTVYRNSGTAIGYVGSSKYIHSGTIGDFAIGTASSNNLTFGINSSEKMRINSNGHVLIGTTDAGVYDDASDEAGHNILANGQYYNSAVNEINMILNRQNIDGDIVQLRKDGAAVGSFGSNTTAGQKLLDIFGTQNLRIVTNSSERLRIDSTGDINFVSSSSGLINLNFTDSGLNDYARIEGGKSGSGVGDLRFHVYSGGLSEAVRIDNTGRVLVGTTNGDVGGSVTGIALKNNGSILSSTDSTSLGTQPLYADRRGTNNEGDILMLALGGFYKSSIGVLGTSSSSDNGGITFNTIANNSSKTERMRIDSSGDLTVKGGRIFINESDNGNTAIGLTRDVDEGYVQVYSAGSITTSIRGNGDSYFTGGNLLVGMTTDGVTSTGIGLVPDGVSHMYSAGDGDNATLMLGRGGDDGNILSFNRSGTTVGSIATYGNDLIVGTGDTRLRFVDSLDSVLPVSNSTGTSRDAGIDLGHSETRFKDIYTSGGIYLGAASNSTPVAANKLDDYEEGTYDITLNQGGVSVNSSYHTWRYTKIGRMVYIEGLFLANSGGDTNIIKINLPFAYLSRSGNTPDQIISTVGTYKVPTGSGGLKGAIVHGTSLLRFHKTFDNGVWTSLVGTEIASGDHIYVNLAYPTT